MQRKNTYRGQGVKSDGLEADEVVTGGDGRRDRGRPGAVLLDHETVGPGTRIDAAADETLLVNLEL